MSSEFHSNFAIISGRNVEEQCNHIILLKSLFPILENRLRLFTYFANLKLEPKFYHKKPNALVAYFTSCLHNYRQSLIKAIHQFMNNYEIC